MTTTKEVHFISLFLCLYHVGPCAVSHAAAPCHEFANSACSKAAFDASNTQS